MTQCPVQIWTYNAKKNMTFREKKVQRHFSIKPGASCLNAISFKARSVTMDY